MVLERMVLQQLAIGFGSAIRYVSKAGLGNGRGRDDCEFAKNGNAMYR